MDKTPGIILYPEDIERIKKSVKPQYQFAVIYALSVLATTGEYPTEEQLGEGGMVAFSFIADKVSDALQKYRETSEKRKEAASKRWDKSETMQTDANECKSIQVDAKAPKTKTETETEIETKKENVKSSGRATRFTPPTVEEVRGYCQERRNTVDPQRFVDFYAAKGWRVGNQPMKDWRAAVRTWEGREGPRGQPIKADFQRRTYTADEYAGMYTDLTAEIAAQKAAQ